MVTAEGDAFQIDGADLPGRIRPGLHGRRTCRHPAPNGRLRAGVELTLRANIAGTTLSVPVAKAGLPPYRPRAASSPTVFRTADLNGNGSTDLVWRNRDFGNDSWEWLDLMPDAGKPNLLTRIDNSLGKITRIEYGNAHEDYVRARDAGQPWTSKCHSPCRSFAAS
ncbi:MAG: toxin TcdB middle/N-terminal domain-containing protein [Verrucomicrobiales bacterium]